MCVKCVDISRGEVCDVNIDCCPDPCHPMFEVCEVLEMFEVCEVFYNCVRCVQVHRARCVRSTSTTAVPTRAGAARAAWTGLMTSTACAPTGRPAKPVVSTGACGECEACGEY